MDCTDLIERLSEAPTAYVSEGGETTFGTSDTDAESTDAIAPGRQRSKLWARRNRTLNLASLACEGARSAKMQLEHEPEILEKYEMKNVLGAGQICTVYRASLRKNPEKEVAVKVLKDCQDSAAARATRLECEILKLLPPHPHVVRAVDFLELCAHGPALVLEFFDGPTLHQLVSTASQRRLPEVSVRAIGFALFQAVAHLHAFQVLHRDIKPQNIFVTPNLSSIQLGDFNVAKHIETYESVTPVGDFLHRAPEVLSGEAPSKSSDVWSSGVSVLFALCGDSPQYRKLRRPTTKTHVLDTQDSCWDFVSNAMKASLSGALNYQPSSRPCAAQLATESTWFGNERHHGMEEGSSQSMQD
jgi:serine/threonine protein kinase